MKFEPIITIRDDDKKYLWLRYLEDYESLFPEAAEVRVKLLGLDRRFSDMYQQFEKSHSEKDFERSAKEGRECNRMAWILIHLGEDLRVHILNLTFSKITGVKIPVRTPFIADVPMLIMEKGVIKLVGNIDKEIQGGKT